MNRTEPDKNRCQIPSDGLILALETSGRTGSVAIGTVNQLLAEIPFSAQMRHSAEVFPEIDTLLTKAGRKPDDIKQVYLSAGPGSFTGLRIAVAFAKMMHLANSAKIVAVDTLDVIAENASDYIGREKASIDKIAVILDAKRGQFFTAVYQKNKNQWKKILPDCLLTASEFLEKFADSTTPLWLLGEGLVYYKDKFKADGISFFDESLWTPKASLVYKLGLQKALANQLEDALKLQPIYLRRAEPEENFQNIS